MKVKFVLFCFLTIFCAKEYDCEIRVDLEGLNMKSTKCSCPYFENHQTVCKHIVCFAFSIERRISSLISEDLRKIDLVMRREFLEGYIEMLNNAKIKSVKGEVSSVTEVTLLIKKLLEENPKLIDVSVEGEISTMSPNKSGHLYFSIKDSKSLLSCAMFKFNAASLNFTPKTGDKVILKGSISVYEPRGSYQLIVKEMRKAGDGDLYAKFLELKDKLAAEGLFDEEHKKNIVKIPRVIGVVTSPTGAVIQDIINTVRRRFPAVKIVLYPAKVQGDGSEESIIAGIEHLQKIGVDTMIVGRGGGSMEDLWCFNDEKLARTIFSCTVPMISAVGHETDFTICDFVSDIRAPTPTAAAEIATPSLSDLLFELDSNKKRLGSSLIRNVERKKEQLAYLESDLVGIFAAKIDGLKGDLSVFKEKLKLLSVKSVLSKGYSLTMFGGKVLKSAGDVKSGDKIKTVLSEGEVDSVVK